jgi:predicted ATPase
MTQSDAPRDRLRVARATNRAPAATRGRRGAAERAPADALVGRHAELARLRAALEAARLGHGGVATVRGEPGIGKTRLLEELVHDAEQCGVLALVGRCHEAADAPALWPWAQVVEGYLERAGIHAIHAHLRPYAAAIAEAIPALRRRLGRTEKVSYLAPGHARFRVLDSMARFLCGAARRDPILVVLEDVHAADAASLRLLEFVAAECRDTGLLLAATYRDLELDEAGTLAATLSALTRGARHDEVSLTGLDAADSTRLIAQAAGAPVADAVVEAVVRQGEGNPLFILELLRSLGEQPSGDHPVGGEERDAGGTLPLGIRRLIAGRLAHLAEPCLRMLTTAAAIGR